MVSFNSSLFNKAGSSLRGPQFSAKENSTTTRAPKASSHVLSADTYTVSLRPKNPAATIDTSRYYNQDWVPLSNQADEKARFERWKKQQQQGNR